VYLGSSATELAVVTLPGEKTRNAAQTIRQKEIERNKSKSSPSIQLASFSETPESGKAI
jgi:hypothetical protein